MNASAEKFDEIRLGFTRPYDELKSLIKAAFDEHIDRINAARDSVSAKLTTWLRAEKVRKDAGAAAERQRQEEEARRLADAARALGDDDAADEIQELASQAISSEPEKVRVQGVYGGSAGLRDKVTGSVADGNDKSAFLVWAAGNLGSEYLEQIKIGQRLLNVLAKQVKDGKLKAVPGLTITSDEKASVI